MKKPALTSPLAVLIYNNDNNDENENDNRTMAICLKTNTSNAATSFSSLLFGEDIKEDKGTVKEKKCTQVVN